MSKHSSLVVFSLWMAAGAARAEGLDRDPLLAEAPATPGAGTLRFSAGARGQTDQPGDTYRVTGTIMWAPFSRFAADVGTYIESDVNGPSVRFRYQLLSQSQAGIDLGIGIRYKKVGFFSGAADGEPTGELEGILAAGRRFGQFDLILNGVFGGELGGPGRDLELKGFAGYRLFDDALRVGVDSRFQSEVHDEAGTQSPTWDRTDVRAGPAAALLLFHGKVELQALIGIHKPRGTSPTSPAGLFLVSLDI